MELGRVVLQGDAAMLRENENSPRPIWGTPKPDIDEGNDMSIDRIDRIGRTLTAAAVRASCSPPSRQRPRRSPSASPW